MFGRLIPSMLLAVTFGLAGCASSGGERAEADEVEMKFAEAPEAVRATLTREANGAAIQTVEREMEKGVTIYEADVVQDGKKWEIEVDETGKLLGKTADDEDDDGEDDDDEKDDD